MPLNPLTLSKALEIAYKDILVQITKPGFNPEDAPKLYAEATAKEVTKWLQTQATVTISSGAIQVTTAGTAAAQTGANTNPVVGKII